MIKGLILIRLNVIILSGLINLSDLPLWLH